MKLYSRLIAGTSLLMLTACSAQPDAATLSSPSAEQIDAHWFSGAELCRYELTQSRYGNEHPGHAEFIFVTEPFDLKEQVKSDTGGPGTVPVLKLNALRTFNTGIYSYRTMRSTFTPIGNLEKPHALKETLSVQDWCGQVFTQINRHQDDWQIRSFSYFQSEGDQTRTVNANDAWLEEEWLTVARLNPTALPTGNFRAMPSQLFFRFIHQDPAVFDAVGKLIKRDDATTYQVNYPQIGRTVTITFDNHFPHIIREWTEGNERSGQQTRAKLTHRQMNVNYWEQNQPADRHLRKQLGLAPDPH